MELHSLGGEGALEKVRDLEVEAERDAREKFEHRDLGTKTVPDRAELKADRARADDEEFPRRFIETKRLGAADDGLAVKRHARQVDRHAAGRDHDVIGGDHGRFAFVGPNPHFAWLGDGAEAGKSRDLVALHERAHPASEGFHDLVLAREHGREVEADFVEHDAVLGGFFFREDEMVARSEERLARDATDVETGATELRVFFDNGGFESELGGANRADVAAGAGADDDDVEFIHENRLRLLSSSGVHRCHRAGGTPARPERRGRLCYNSSKSAVGFSIASLTLTRKVTASLPSTAR